MSNCVKVAYRSSKQALVGRAKMSRGDPWLQPYLCRRCGWWHLGENPPTRHPTIKGDSVEWS